MVGTLSLIDIGRIHSTEEWGLFNESQPLLKGSTVRKNFCSLKRSFLDDVVATVEIEKIPPVLILNWDQTGIQLVPSTSWSIEQRGIKGLR